MGDRGRQPAACRLDRPRRRDVRPRDLQLVPEGESSTSGGDFASQIARS